MLTRQGECHQCGECCRTVNITVVRDATLEQHGNRKELELYLGYRGIRVVGEDNRCQVHDTPEKPLSCYRYPWEPDDIEQCGFRFLPTAGFLPGVSGGKP